MVMNLSAKAVGQLHRKHTSGMDKTKFRELLDST